MEMECNNNEINDLTDNIMNKVQIVQNSRKYSESFPMGVSKTSKIRQFLMVTLANLGVVSTGMGLGFPAVSLNQLKDTSQTFFLNSDQASWFASINAISCPLGGLLSGYLLDKFGRKKTILAFNLTAAIAWGLLICPFSSDNSLIYVQIMIARCLIGIATGLASSPAGVYSAEICHISLRGRLTLGTSIATALGIMMIYVLGYFIVNDYQLISLIVFGYSVFSLISCYKIPESPIWLLSKNRNEEALKNLQYFRGADSRYPNSETSVNNEWDNLLNNSLASQGQKKPNFKAIIKQPQVYKPLLIMIGFFGFQQFSGIFVVIVYAVQFSIEAGVTIDPLICAILIGLTRTITTCLVGIVLDKWGRRPSAIYSACGMAVCMLLLAAATWLPDSVGQIPFIKVACIILYIFTSTLGLMTLPFSMISEVFPTNVRGKCAGITICCGYLMSFLTIKFYPGMVDLIGNGSVFAVYGFVSVVAILYVYVFLPETKGKTLQQIEDYFKSNSNNQNLEDIQITRDDIFRKA